MPLGASIDAFHWRASIAEISADGPFSTFAGIDRVIVLLGGEGAHLRSNDGVIDHRLDTPLAPFVFAGEVAIDASLIGGASSDFNIMTRRDIARSDVRTLIDDERLDACSAGVLFPARGHWDVQATGALAATHTLDANHGVWWNGDSLSWDVVPRSADAALIAVRILANSER